MKDFVKAKEKIIQLGFQLEERGTLMAILTTLDEEAFKLIFDDDDIAIKASLKQLLKNGEQQRPRKRPLEEEQKEEPLKSKPFEPKPKEGEEPFDPVKAFLLDPTSQPQSSPTKRPHLNVQNYLQSQMPPPAYQPFNASPLGYQNQMPPAYVGLQSMPPPSYNNNNFFQPPPNVNVINEGPDEEEDLPEIPQPDTQQSAAQEVVPLEIQVKGYLPAIRFDQRVDYLTMVSLKAPKIENRTTNLDIVAVLDQSGSMAGEKLNLLKKATLFVASQLGERDRLSIITFNDHPTRLCHSVVMNKEGKKKVAQLIAKIHSIGGTKIAPAVKTALDIMNGRKNKANEGAVILLSDGQGDTVDQELMKEGFLQKPATDQMFAIHTFGFGADHDARLLGQIALNNRGTFCFISKVKDVVQAFANCLGGLLTLFAKNISVSVTIEGEGNKFKKLHTKFANEIGTDQKSCKITIPDMYAGETRDILIELDVMALKQPGKEQKLLTASGIYSDVAKELAGVILPPVEFKFNRPKEVDPNQVPDDIIDQQRNRIISARVLEESAKFSEQQDFVKSGEVLQAAIKQIQDSLSANTNYSRALIQDLQTTMNHNSSSTSYNSTGRAWSMQQQQVQWVQRHSYSPSSASSHLNATPCQNQMLQESKRK